jgi:hypothetical protein
MATNVPVLPSPMPASPVPAEEVTRKAPDDRKEALGRAVHTQIAQGARAESQSDYSATLDGSTKIWRLTLFEWMICGSIFLSILILGFLAGAG